MDPVIGGRMRRSAAEILDAARVGVAVLLLDRVVVAVDDLVVRLTVDRAERGAEGSNAQVGLLVEPGDPAWIGPGQRIGDRLILLVADHVDRQVDLRTVRLALPASRASPGLGHERHDGIDEVGGAERVVVVVAAEEARRRAGKTAQARVDAVWEDDEEQLRLGRSTSRLAVMSFSISATSGTCSSTYIEASASAHRIWIRVDVRAAEGRVVRGAVLRVDGVDVLAAAAVVRHVREVLVEARPRTSRRRSCRTTTRRIAPPAGRLPGRAE